MLANPVFRIRLPLLSGLLCLALFVDRLPGADEMFVGRLALAVRDDVVKRLGISEEVRGKLLSVIDRREQDALNLALELKDLPPSEKEARLAPFIAESEKQGLELLSPEQRSTLDMIRIGVKGMATLAEPTVAKAVGLSDEQTQKVAAILEQRARDMTKGGERERRVVRDTYERQLAEILTREQRTEWEKLAGYAEGAPLVQAEAPPEGSADRPKMAATTTPSAGTPTPAGTPDTQVPLATSEEDWEELPPEDVKLRFNFHHAPYKDVLEWFAKQAGLSLQLEIVPPGTFNYRDPRSYTPAQGIDILNRALLTKGFSVLRHGRMMTVINIDDKFVPDALLEIVSIEELDLRGEFEITRCIFDLKKMRPEEAETEIRKLLGPLGDVKTLASAKQVVVTETGGRLRAIREMIRRIEDPDAMRDQKITEITLKHIPPDDFMITARELLGLPLNQNSSNDIRISVDLLGSRLFATGTPEMTQKLQEIVALLDRDPNEGVGATVRVPEQPQLETYHIQSADPAMTLKVVQTLLAGLPDVRVDVDTVSGRLIALARPSDHKTIKETLRMLEGQVSQFEIIPLRRTDPTVVLATINKFFGLDGKAKGDAPIVDADLSSMKLYVRATPIQLAQIKTLVEKLEGGDATAAQRSNVRVIPLSGGASDEILRNAERLWTGKNSIRLITPSSQSSIIKQRTVTPPRSEDAAEPSRPNLERPIPGDAPSLPLDLRPSDLRPSDLRPAPPRNPERPNGRPEAPGSRENPPTTRLNRSRNLQFVAQVNESPTDKRPDELKPLEKPIEKPAEKPVEKPVEKPAVDAPKSDSGSQSTPEKGANPEKGEIRITAVPNGIVISSDDQDALDAFEELVRTLAGPAASATHQEFTVFYLRYAKAEVAQILITDMLGGGGGGSGGGSLLGGMASNMFGGGLLGGLMGNMLGGGGGGGAEAGPQTVQASGQVRMIADARLNALIVFANQADADVIEQLLKIVDQEGSMTDIETDGAPRMIRLEFISAEEAAETVKAAFANRIAGGGAQGRQSQQPSPEEFIRALRGGGGRQEREQRGEPAKMTVAADKRNNALIVTAPEPLFREVEALVTQIDQEGTEASEATSVYTLRFSKADHVQKTLSALLGANARSRGSTSGSSASTSGGPPSGGPPPFSPEMFQRMREMGRGGGPGGFGGGGGDSRRDGGGGSRGGDSRGGDSRGGRGR